jgi:hypothetical protein
MMVGLVVIGGAVGGVLLYLRGQMDNDSTTLPSSTDPPGGIIPVLTTPTPTSAPTSRTNLVRAALWNAIGATIAPTESAINAIQNPNTPQYAAWEWLIEDYDSDSNNDASDSSSTLWLPPDDNSVVWVERYALAVLYFTTGGGPSAESSWKDPLEFLSSRPVCDWNNGLRVDNDAAHGVYCESSVDIYKTWVTVLHMADNGLAGPLPWELSLVTQLVQLDMDANVLTGTLPTEWPIALTNLQAMWLHSNALTGSLPTTLNRMKRLASLDLQNNALTGSLPEVWGTTQLQDLFYIALRGNALDGTLPASWQKLHTSLRFLDLEDNQLQGSIPTEFGALTALESLFLETNRLEGSLPSELGRLEALQQFLVYDNRLTGTIPNEYQNWMTNNTTNHNLEVFLFDGNDLTGSVDAIFCEDRSSSGSSGINDISSSSASSLLLLPDLRGDCLGDPPEIICTCCASCCTADGATCEPQQP